MDPNSAFEGPSARNLPLLHPKPYGIVTRPVVAWAVLQTPSSFVKWHSHPFPPNLQNINAPKLLDLGTWNFETMFTTSCLSRVMCHMTCFTCHMTCFTCHMSHVTCQVSNDISIPKLLKLGTWNSKRWSPTPFVICYVSNVLYHISCFMCHVS